MAVTLSARDEVYHDCQRDTQGTKYYATLSA